MRLAKDDKSRKYRHKQEALDETFEQASQSSLVELIKSEKREMRQEDDIVKDKEQKKHRKPLHKSGIGPESDPIRSKWSLLMYINDMGPLATSAQLSGSTEAE